MKCLEARQLFSAHLDGELAPAEGELLRAHLAECGACAADFELERAVSLVLRESAVADPLTRQSGYPRVPRAPEGFARGVTAAIEKRRRGRAVGWFGGWRPALAAAAASLLIAAGALGYGAQQWLARGPVIAQHDLPGAVGEVTAPAGDVPAAPVTESPGGTGQGGETPGVAPAGERAGPGQAPVTKPDAAPETRPDREPGRTQVAVAPVEQKVFLNKPRSIESTLIKLNVDHPAQVRNQALLVAGDAGAALQSQAAQSGTVEVLRFYVDPGKAEQFTNRLADLGRVADRQSDSRDITRQFASTLEQYQELLAQRPRVTDPGELATLDERIASLERWLTEHDREAEEHVVVLVLQQN
ncbi:zf-HC2 domain-containing protein [Candidatus Desulforudis audaxviator]|uniref:Putative transmembrane anti-sigma factor n=1 Tax=Desulforudis audaxviator (strain MP104C) TaxID=477974 RepID=B1I6K3_DESAP|nr:zf-HC2 domain-containing protein [Candidatus Desulforudis audaxviator]ACA60613.1 putative transmembrane anti-sigma factor [Candidatus Desulforudis audaxviator MP104C]AZK60695.1 putative membrane protein [Candidatus Desulforudis audaxviator]